MRRSLGGTDFLQDLWANEPGTPHLLHGDFGPSNTLRRRAVLAPIDFQDVQFGFGVQDVGLTLADLDGDGVPREIQDAFLAGYRRRRPVDLDAERRSTLAALRALGIIGFSVAVEHPEVERLVATEMTPIERWMRAGGAA